MTTPLLILLAALQVADGYTTIRILGNGGTELNPVMARLFARFGMTPTLIVKGIVVVVAGYFAGLPVLALMCVGYVGLILFNMRSLP